MFARMYATLAAVLKWTASPLDEASVVHIPVYNCENKLEHDKPYDGDIDIEHPFEIVHKARKSSAMSESISSNIAISSSTVEQVVKIKEYAA